MSRVLPLIVALLGLAVVAPAWAGSWSLGAQMGAITIRSGAGGGTSTVVALPLNTLSYQPGLRLAFGDERHTREACFEGGLLVIDESGSVVTFALGSLGYQHVFMRQSASSPYANVTVGVLSEGGVARHGNSLTCGAALGLRRVIHDDRGAIRIEARYDLLQAGGPYVRPELTTLGLRFGFDLWL